MGTLTRRTLLRSSMAGTASLLLPRLVRAADLGPVEREIQRRHGEALQRLQEWIHQPTIAAEGIGGEDAVQLFMHLLRDAGFQAAARVPTDGFPGVFATPHRRAPRAVRRYLLYVAHRDD